MATLQITLPDGATREVPSGTTAAEIAQQISPRLAKEALVARADGELIDLSRPLDHDVKLSILTAKDPDAVQVLRHSAAHLLAAAVLELYPDVKLGVGPADRHRLLLRIPARPAVHSGRPRENRGQDARACRQGHPQRTQADAQARGARPLSPVETGIQMRAGRGKGRRADGVFLHHRQIHRLLPRPAHPVHRAHQGVQAHERRRRLLERPRRQSADAADLRRLLRRSEGARRISPQARRGEAPRPSQARHRARSFQHSGRSRPRPDLLAPEGRDHPQADGRLAARRICSRAATISSSRRTSWT